MIVLWGLLYSVPNLYPDDEALQITTEGLSLNSADIEVVTTALEAAQVEFFGVEGNDTNLLVRFDSVEDQLRAKTAIEDALGADYIVALNLAPTTPNWMQAIGAGKMNLGLDLQGGVHFLMEVDMDAALERRMNDNLSNVRTILREERIRTRGLNLISNSHLEVRFANAGERSQARSELIDNFPEMLFQNRDVGDIFILDMRMTADTILQVHRDTLQANRTTLLNRVDALGVAEPTVQQQGANRIVVELPGVQDPAQAIRILQRIATLEFHLEAEIGATSLSYEPYEYQGLLVNVDNDVILQGDRVSNVRSTLDQNGLPQVQINLD
ncbi:uncharacterized protein METZ01_LOCUS345312, partial [marine metagenome]